jgi:zinc transport system permease protein
MLEIFAYDFMVRAFIAGVITALIAPTIGIFLVTRRYSYMADTLAHVSLAGLAIGYLLGFQPILTALVASVAAALSIEGLRASRRLFGETALSLFLSGGLSVAAVLLSVGKTANLNLGSLLFGSITTVSKTDVITIAVLATFVIVIIVLLYKELFAVSFDEELAESSGFKVRLINNLLVILAAMTVSLALRTVGVLLVGALMIIPVVAALQWQRGFLQTLIFSIVISLFSVVTGIVISFYLGFASGGTIVLITIGLFIFSALWRGLRAA